MRAVLALLACLAATGQCHRVHLAEGKAQEISQETHKLSEKASRNISLAKLKRYKANPSAGFPKALAALLLAFNSTAAWQASVGKVSSLSGTNSVSSLSGTNSGMPRSLGLGSTSFLNPQVALHHDMHDADLLMPGRARRHGGPLMEVETTTLEGGDDDFAKALSRLAPSAELPELRKKVRELESLISKAIDDQDFAVELQLRNEAKELHSKDPALLRSFLRSRIQALLKDDQYEVPSTKAAKSEEAAKYQDQLDTLNRFQPEYQLAGTWKGKFPIFGAGSPLYEDMFVRIHYDNDKLTAMKLDGDMIFEADVSESRLGVGPASHMSRTAHRGSHEQGGAEHFVGQGVLGGGGYVPGQMFVMDDDVIGFLWEGKPEIHVVGKGRGVVRGGIVEGNSGKEFVVFRRSDEDNALGDLTPSAATLEKLFKLDSSAVQMRSKTKKKDRKELRQKRRELKARKKALKEGKSVKTKDKKQNSSS